jgi:hypothetical protein
MAAEDILQEINIRYFEQNISDNDVNLCEKGSKMREDLKVAFNGLKSTQEIVKILQEEIQKKNFNNSVTEDNLSHYIDAKTELKQHNLNRNVSEWKKVPRNKPSVMQLKKARNELNYPDVFIPLIENRFKPLSDYQDLTSQHDCDIIKLKPLSGSINNVTNKHKIIILGDSHERGCSEKLASILGKGCNVTGISKPSANMSTIFDSKFLKAEKLTKKDVVIIMAVQGT